MLPIINKLKLLSYQRPTAYRYGSGPERSGCMLSSRPKKWWYAIPAHTVSLSLQPCLALSHKPARPNYTARPRIRASVSRDVPVYSPSFYRVLISPIHEMKPRREWTWVSGSSQRWFISSDGPGVEWSREVSPLRQTGNCSTLQSTPSRVTCVTRLQVNSLLRSQRLLALKSDIWWQQF